MPRNPDKTTKLGYEILDLMEYIQSALLTLQSSPPEYEEKAVQIMYETSVQLLLIIYSSLEQQAQREYENAQAEDE